jgi:hypothetical protein
MLESFDRQAACSHVEQVQFVQVQVAQASSQFWQWQTWVSVVVMDVNLLGVVDRVLHDVSDVVVGESVGHLAPAADSLDEVGAAKNAEVLTDQRLRQVEGFDQLVDAPLALGELGDQGYPYWGGECPKELARLGVSVVQLRLSHMRILAYSNSLTQVAERPVCDALDG